MMAALICSSMVSSVVVVDDDIIRRTHIEVVLSYMAGHFGILNGDWLVETVDNYIVYNDEDGNTIYVDGAIVNEREVILIFIYNECVISSPLIHMLLHAYGYKHSSDFNELENKLREGIMLQMCPDFVSSTPPTPAPPFVDIPKIYKLNL